MQKKRKRKKYLSQQKREPVAVDVNTAGFEVRENLDKGDARKALEIAEAVYKQHPTQDITRLLASAYSARAEQLVSSNLVREARALLQIALEKHPVISERIEEASFAVWAAGGEMSMLLSGYEDMASAKRNAVDRAVYRWVREPQAVADCTALPAHHSLRAAAAATVEALERVTRQPVRDDDIQLTDVSRRSPFAPWKHLVRAIAAFYRGEDDVSRSFALSVPRDSAPYPLAELLKALIDETDPSALGSTASKLYCQVLDGRARLARLLDQADAALGMSKSKTVLRAIKDVIKETERSAPWALVRLRQHVSIRAYKQSLNFNDTRRAMGGYSLKDAYFWKLFATSYEQELRKTRSAEVAVYVCLFWNEFLYHAKCEGLIADGSIGEAVVYLRMARALTCPSNEALDECLALIESGDLPPIDEYVAGQPEEIRSRMSRDRSKEIVMDPRELFVRAVELASRADIYREWFDWTRQRTKDWREWEKVLTAWHLSKPEDLRALVHLGELAEQRGALKKVLGFTRKARLIDAMNTDLNRLHHRALAGMATRHIRQAKAHLAKKDIDELSDLVGVTDSAPRAFIAALRGMSALSVDELECARGWIEEVIALLGDRLVASGLLGALAAACRIELSKIEPLLPPADILVPCGRHAEALATLSAIGRSLEMELGIPGGWKESLLRDAEGDLTVLGAQRLTLIAKVAAEQSEYELLYGISRAGLSLGPSTRARFLLFRAKSLPAGAWAHRTVLSRAAAGLARRQGEQRTAEEALDFARASLARSGMSRGLLESELEKINEYVADDSIRLLVDKELEMAAYRSHPSSDPLEKECREEWIEDEICGCPFCRAGRGERVMPWELEDDDILDDDESELESPFGIGMDFGLSPDSPPEDFEQAARAMPDALDRLLPGIPRRVLPLLLEMIVKYGDEEGMPPEVDDLELQDPELFRRFMNAAMGRRSSGRKKKAGKKTKRKRRR